MIDFLYSQLKLLTEDGFWLSFPRFGNVLSRFVNLTQPITNDTTRPSEIYGGDLLRSVNMLVTLAEYNSANQGRISSEGNDLKVATAVSNLLDTGNAITWQNLEEVRALS